MAKSQIIKDLANGKIDTQTALKRTKVLLRDLQDEESLKWVTYELEGYPEDVEVPEYRVISGQLIGSYIKGSMAYHMKYTNVPLSLGTLPDNVKDSILTLHMSEGVSALQEIIKDNKDGLIKPIPAELYNTISHANNDRYMIINSAYVSLNMPKILNIFPKIESKLLDILSYLENEFGNLDDLDIDITSKSASELSSIKDAINVIIYSDHSTTIGNNNTIKNSNISAE